MLRGKKHCRRGCSRSGKIIEAVPVPLIRQHHCCVATDYY
jgi:hypothetical protein